ncbi:MAG: Rpn family recombination-promoting nuclease/putative transposase [Propionibacteriaceae bacterium]|jgi:predicted transposase/invertase (TIGR01784 family)|nr:Rpn family recombination-promoting nuclease/putative transposase [Propionibacteriaceae bacterium]
MPKPRAILPTNDLAFKRLLASEDHKNVTQGFIKDLFGIDVELNKIRFRTPYSIYVVDQDDAESTKQLRTSIRDITIEVESADLTVELQIHKEDFFTQRALYYAANLLTARKEDSKDDRDETFKAILPVRSLNILGFNMFDCEHAQHTFWLRDDTWVGERLALDWLSVGFLELRKSIFADNRAQLWAQFLLSGLAPDGAPDYLVEAERIVEYWKLSRKERIMMSVLERERVREANERYTARREGHEEGLAEGLAKGLAQGEAKGLAKGEAKGYSKALLKIAAGALSQGISVEDVAEFTGLTVEELAELH